MDKQELTQLLQQVADGDVTPDDAALRLKMQPFQEIGAYAKVDFHRGIRQGVPEVIFGEGKAKEHILGIAREMLRSGQRTILITRLSAEAAAYLETNLPLHYDSTARVGIIGELPPPGGKGRIVVATGGTSDIPVAEEAALTAQALGNDVVRLYDVGVSGLHRLLANLDTIMSARVIVAVAGMEGALPSVIGGLADCPVIAVPHERRLRRVARRDRGAAEHAQFLRKRYVRREHRQRFWRGLSRQHDQSSRLTEASWNSLIFCAASEGRARVLGRSGFCVRTLQRRCVRRRYHGILCPLAVSAGV